MFGANVYVHILEDALNGTLRLLLGHFPKRSFPLGVQCPKYRPIVRSRAQTYIMYIWSSHLVIRPIITGSTIVKNKSGTRQYAPKRHRVSGMKETPQKIRFQKKYSRAPYAMREQTSTLLFATVLFNQRRILVWPLCVRALERSTLIPSRRAARITRLNPYAKTLTYIHIPYLPNSPPGGSCHEPLPR